MCALLFIICLHSPPASTLALTRENSWQQGQQSQEKEKKDDPQVREHVEVINVELILRAILKGKTIANLKKEDITIYEDGTQVPITSFLPVTRKLGLLEKMKEEKQKELDFKTGKPGTDSRLLSALPFDSARRHVGSASSYGAFHAKSGAGHNERRLRFRRDRRALLLS